MHVIRLHIEFYYFNTCFLFTQLVYQSFHLFSYLFLQDSVAIFGTKYNMVLAFI